ncbi:MULTISPECIES: hypothetical protein [Haloarcula]|uniref:Uncharacterized protein n=3 Tax=Haloarcula TaxID=2237 RepID=A0ACC6VQX1_9EURY|nr:MULTISPECIES: hypothetical protein [Haloarcula]EMA31498.1 hypothetical protein C444_07885 [Haloarcula japonica DSM 6131]GGK79756.1 hypothetical protein GCM10009067_35110 [Haloarcula sebkhae]
MNVLSGKELEFYIEKGLVKNAHEDAPFEDIKVPLRYGGITEKRTKTIEGNSTYERTKESTATIRPGETKLFLTKEDVTTREIGKEYPIRIFGRIYPPNSFVRGAQDVGTGPIDTNWQGGEPLRIAISNNKKESRVTEPRDGKKTGNNTGKKDAGIEIQEGDIIAYVIFEYVSVTTTLDEQTLEDGRNLSEPRFREKDVQSAARRDREILLERIEELEEKYAELLNKIE